jgi:hypothetical protein
MTDVIPALSTRYQFVEAPTTLKDYTTTEKAVEFGHGKLPLKIKGKKQEYILIQKLQIFSDGIVTQTSAGSEFADIMLDDVLNWFKKEYALEIVSESLDQRAYVSHVEVELSINLDRLVAPADFIVGELGKLFKAYKQDLPPYEVTSFALNYDLLKHRLPQPAAFQLERRGKQPFESNFYFSAAPLRTPDHLKLLEKIEKWAASKHP